MVELVATIGSWLITTGLPETRHRRRQDRRSGHRPRGRHQEDDPIIADAFVRIAQGSDRNVFLGSFSIAYNFKKRKLIELEGRRHLH
jgi:hypothetical protein